MASCTVWSLKLSVIVRAALTGLGLSVIDVDITALPLDWTTTRPVDKAGIRNLIPAVDLASQSAIKKFSALSVPIIFSKFDGVQLKFSPVLMHNIESMHTAQLIVDNIKVRPFLRDVMDNVSKFFWKEDFNIDWSKQWLNSFKMAYKYLYYIITTELNKNIVI